MKYSVFFFLVSFFSFIGTTSSFASTDSENLIMEDVLSSFRSVYNIPAFDILVPTVIQIPLVLETSSTKDIAIFSINPYDQMGREGVQLFSQSKRENPIFTIKKEDGTPLEHLSDTLYEKYEEFLSKENGESTLSRLTIEFLNPLTVSSFSFSLDRYVALPETIEIKALTDEGEKIVLVEKKMDSRVVSFPPTKAKSFSLSLKHIQPLRITEIEPIIEDLGSTKEEFIRFLAQPNHRYDIYVDADRKVTPYQKEMPFLNGKDFFSYQNSYPKISNGYYKKADIDGDGIEDEKDNCVHIKNEDQEDLNKNNLGDACEDFDKDGVINSVDNCPHIPNSSQKDSDLDGIGDVCDDKENRFFQRNIWILPMFIIFVCGVFVFLIFQMIRHEKKT